MKIEIEFDVKYEPDTKMIHMYEVRNKLQTAMNIVSDNYKNGQNHDLFISDFKGVKLKITKI